MTANDKQMYKRYNAEQGGTPHDLQALSPPQTSLGTSPAQGCLRYIFEKYFNLCRQSVKTFNRFNYLFHADCIWFSG